MCFARPPNCSEYGPEQGTKTSDSLAAVMGRSAAGREENEEEGGGLQDDCEDMIGREQEHLFTTIIARNFIS